MNRDAKLLSNINHVFIGYLNLNERTQDHFFIFKITEEGTLLANSNPNSSNLSARNQQDLAEQINNFLNKKTAKQSRHRRKKHGELSKINS